MPPSTPAPVTSPTPTVRLRNLVSKVVVGTDGPTLEVALQAAFDAGGEAVLVAILYVADFKVLLVYST